MLSFSVTADVDGDERDMFALRRAFAAEAARLLGCAPEDVTVDAAGDGAPAGGPGRHRNTPNEIGDAAVAVVRDYLAAMEARDLARATAHLAPEFRMVFPGGAEPPTLEALVARSGSRYRRVSKAFERFDAVPANEGVIVYCFGTLRGEWADGTAFEDVRFIDRFTVRDGKLVDQRVWNDAGERLAAARQAVAGPVGDKSQSEMSREGGG